MNRVRPVLYLDLDDTLIRWEHGRPSGAPGAHEFLLWALQHFEVRWLTTWCPGGDMEQGLFQDLCKLLRMPPDQIHHIRGGDWTETASKLNGLLWLEHLVLGRPFFWVEDENGVGERERRVLAEQGLLDCYVHVNVSTDAQALIRAHERLRQRLDENPRAA